MLSKLLQSPNKRPGGFVISKNPPVYEERRKEVLRILILSSKYRLSDFPKVYQTSSESQTGLRSFMVKSLLPNQCCLRQSALPCSSALTELRSKHLPMPPQQPDVQRQPDVPQHHPQLPRAGEAKNDLYTKALLSGLAAHVLKWERDT